MKWKNKGHEFDSYADTLMQIFHRKQRKIYIFGAGLIGTALVSVYERYHCFAGYIDNDIQKQMIGVNEKKVISLKQYISDGAQGIIIVAVDKTNISKIKDQLNTVNLYEGKDFWIYKEFMQDVFPVLSVYEFEVLYVSLAQICLTERCTLRCKDCAHGCYAVDYKSTDMSFEIAKKSADAFFSKVDIVGEFVLLGGEPFLYNNLLQVIEYIGSNYRDKMIMFSITTNGTIMPKREILDLCRKYNVLIRISNYSGTVKHLQEKYVQLQKSLEDCRVSYILGDQEAQWMDYGFKTVDRGQQEEELVQVFDRCKTSCREIRESKYYFCVMARSVSDNLDFHIGKEDYLDFDEYSKNQKKILLEFEHGYSEKGYLDMCNHCNGADAIKYPIPAAEQVD